MERTQLVAARRHWPRRAPGRAGEDFIETKDGEQDDLECDSGNNIARVDFGDRIARPWLCRIMDLDFGEHPFYVVG